MLNSRAPPLYDGGMYPVPTSLSPSRVESFTSCPLAFRFASIEKLPELPSVHTTRGSLVHRVLELLFLRPPAQRRAPESRGAKALDTDSMRFQDSSVSDSHRP